MFDVVDFEMMMILNSEYFTLLLRAMNILPSLLRDILFSKFMNILFNPDVILFLKGKTLLSKMRLCSDDSFPLEEARWSLALRCH